MKNEYDAIVIGSGIGGLTTAAILARMNNQKVLVLEKHYEIGGLTHEFRRGPYSWDVGLHYVGAAVTRGIGEAIFHYICDGNLKWNQMEGTYDRFMFPDFTIESTKSRQKFEDDFIARFPDEEKAIKRYFKDLDRCRLWFIKNYLSTIWPAGLAGFLNLLNMSTRKLALMTTGQYLEKNFKNPKLKAALVSRWGDYGLPPGESSFAVHSVTEFHYLDGAFFPDGGSEKIGLYAEEVIEKSGGCILTNKEVTEIIVEGNKAVGVNVRDVNDPNSSVNRLDAPLIISSAGAWITYNKLLPSALGLKEQRVLEEFNKGYSTVTMYIGLKDSPKSIGIDGANHWIFNTYDFDGSMAEFKNGYPEKNKTLFLSFPSLKNNKPGGHTAEIVSFVTYDIFEKWKDQPWKQRDPEYYDLKEEISLKLLASIEEKIPGFNDLIAFRELGTPLTIEHFTGRPNGSLYGVPCTPERFASNFFQAKTPIKNLLLSGADASTLGIMGSLLGGVAAAAAASGSFSFFKLVGRATRALKNSRKAPDRRLENTDSETKIHTAVSAVESVGKTSLQLSFKYPDSIHLFPGQHIKLKVADNEWRSYSLAKLKMKTASLLIDTKFSGIGSNYVAGLAPGDKLTVRLPLSDYVFHETTNDIVFFSTSVGIAPTISILEKLLDSDYKGKVYLFFGSPTEEDLFVQPLLQEYVDKLGLKVTYCVEAGSSNPGHFKGFVTEAFKNAKLDAPAHEYYICGNPHMVQNTVNMLRKSGASLIFW